MNNKLKQNGKGSRMEKKSRTSLNVNVNLWAPKELVEQFNRVIEGTYASTSEAIRALMREVVEKAEAKA